MNNELFAALSAAQSEIFGAVKDTTNTFFKAKYADLAAVLDAIRVPFAKNGLCLTQVMLPMSGGLVLRSILGHKSGQFIASDIPVPLPDPKPQAVGSAITYYRRYSAAAICGVAQVDDDGEAAHGRTGIGVHSPMGEVDKSAEAETWKKAFLDALSAENVPELKKIHLDLNAEGEEFYRSVWALLAAKDRTAIKKMLN